MMESRIVLLILLAVQTVYSSDQWALLVEYHSSVTLNCSSPSRVLSQSDQLEDIAWILPSGQLVRTDSSPAGRGNVKLLQNGTEIEISDVDDADFGVYYCIAKLNGEDWLVRKGINIMGPYFGDLTAKYMSKLKTGAMSAGVAFVILSFLLLMYDRNQSQGEQMCDAISLLAKRENLEEGCDNLGMNMKHTEDQNDHSSNTAQNLNSDVDTHF